MQALLDHLTFLATKLRKGEDLGFDDAATLDTAAMRLDCLCGLLAEIETLDPNDDQLKKAEFRGQVRSIARHRFDPIPGFPARASKGDSK